MNALHSPLVALEDRERCRSAYSAVDLDLGRHLAHLMEAVQSAKLIIEQCAASDSSNGSSAQADLADRFSALNFAISAAQCSLGFELQGDPLFDAQRDADDALADRQVEERTAITLAVDQTTPEADDSAAAPAPAAGASRGVPALRFVLRLLRCELYVLESGLRVRSCGVSMATPPQLVPHRSYSSLGGGLFDLRSLALVLALALDPQPGAAATPPPVLVCDGGGHAQRSGSPVHRCGHGRHSHRAGLSAQKAVRVFARGRDPHRWLQYCGLVEGASNHKFRLQLLHRPGILFHEQGAPSRGLQCFRASVRDGPFDAGLCCEGVQHEEGRASSCSRSDSISAQLTDRRGRGTLTRLSFLPAALLPPPAHTSKQSGA